MKKITKQLLALLIAGIMTLALSACGNMFHAKPSEGLEFFVEGGKCSVIDFGTCTDTEIVIPSEYEGMPVTSIGAGAFQKYNRFTRNNYVAIKKIYLPETITSIGDHAFWGCDSLEAVYIGSPKGVRVDSYAFWECTSLKDIDLTKIHSFEKEYLFSNCNSFQEFTIPEGTARAGKGLLKECASLKSLSIPVSITELSVDMCVRCTNLTDIYYSGTMEQWSNITQNFTDTGYSWDMMVNWEKLPTWWDGTGEFTVHCTDGDIPKADAVVKGPAGTLAQKKASS